ncbi:MAG: MBL fold metallo-hydrolase [Pseudomonadota bacterium]
MKQDIKITVLGSGASLGVPAAGGFWGDCNPENPKNSRTRASILIESAETRILVDTTVDVRTQLNRLGQINRLDGIILSHAHSDHINGLDDLRVISYMMEKPLEMYSNIETVDNLTQRFGYIFKGGFNDFYKPFVKANTVDYGPLQIGDIRMEIFEQDHGSCSTLGIRVNDFAYSVDMANLDDRALEVLEGVDTWLVDTAGYKKEQINTHATLDRVMEYVEKLDVPQTWLTVLTGQMDYDALCDELPDHIRPAYDGLTFSV